LEILFSGLHCFGDTGGAGSDEVYFSVEVAPIEGRLDRANNLDGIWATKLPVDQTAYEEIDAGTTYPDEQRVYFGRAKPLKVSVNLWENDLGNPDALKEDIRTAVAVAGAATAIFIPGASAVSTNPDVQRLLTDVINAAADTNDDYIGRGQFTLTRRQILDQLATPPAFDGDVELPQHDLVYLTDGDATYKAYFVVTKRGPVPYSEL